MVKANAALESVERLRQYGCEVQFSTYEGGGRSSYNSHRSNMVKRCQTKNICNVARDYPAKHLQDTSNEGSSDIHSFQCFVYTCILVWSCMQCVRNDSLHFSVFNSWLYYNNYYIDLYRIYSWIVHLHSMFFVAGCSPMQWTRGHDRRCWPHNLGRHASGGWPPCRGQITWIQCGFFWFFFGGFRNSNGSLHSTSNYCLAGGAPKSKPRREGKQFEARHGRKSEMAEAAIQCDWTLPNWPDLSALEEDTGN